MDRPRGARARLRRLRDGSDRPAPRGAAPERRPGAEQRAAALDRGHLRLHGRGGADHDGDARRPDRAAPDPADRRGRLRRRLVPGGVLDERGDADRSACAPRDRGRHDRPVDAVADPQSLPRSRPAHVRDRRLDHGVLARRCRRPAARRSAARVLLVGLGLPARRARDGAPARPGARAAAGVQGSRGGPPRSVQRRTLARGRARDRLRAEADRPGRARPPPRGLDRARRGARAGVRAQAVAPRAPADRPAALPRPGLQRLAGCLHARDPRALRVVPVRLPVPPARARPVAADGRGLDAAFLRLVHRRVDARPGGRAPRASPPM